MSRIVIGCSLIVENRYRLSQYLVNLQLSNAKQILNTRLSIIASDSLFVITGGCCFITLERTDVPVAQSIPLHYYHDLRTLWHYSVLTRLFMNFVMYLHIYYKFYHNNKKREQVYYGRRILYSVLGYNFIKWKQNLIFCFGK